MTDTLTARPFTLALDPMTPPPRLEHAILAVGNFDGIHRGHVAVIERAKALAKARDVPCAVLTFEPHPSDYFGGAGTIFRLSPLDAKAAMIEKLGVDGMIVLTFDAALASLPAEAFVREILVERLGVGGVIAGYDFHFGRHRGGTPAFLKTAGATHGFTVDIVERIDADETGAVQIASSTATRTALEAGDIAQATALLGHPYTIAGPVLPGQQLGRTLGFPTANMQADPSCRLRHGIYAVRATVDGVTHDGVASYGRRPTVDNGAPLLETFLFDFSGDLYGKVMDVAFIAWLRSEEKFDSLEALTVQMLKDAADAKAALAMHPG
ncbi:bifunctional riboflavin kinase/FAD synthetase [Beijerinckia sp. L45]|uniref:bifunctional riboflavin kinase/FAD synthetase n=1 Tax=Beijerinckia sp. L45 TaxID=1641855 RepID=UPI001FEE625C|nr:bifunctional riboflavin kinase/FAD synthetase [Beijerinckia sp. L45]